MTLLFWLSRAGLSAADRMIESVNTVAPALAPG